MSVAADRTGLAAVRADDRLRWGLTIAAVLVGILIASVHWLGLLVAGALVGILQRSLPRALVAGLGVGLLVLAVFILATPRLDPGEFLALRPVVFVTVGAGLGLPLFGALVRGVV